jgi:hypothetical protein
MRLYLVILFILLVFSATGCVTSSGPTVKEAPIVVPSGKSVIVVYRIPSLKSAAYRHHVYLNGTLAARLPSKAFTYFTVDPGTYEVSTRTERNPKILVSYAQANLDEISYIEYRVGANLATPDTLRGIEPQRGAMNLINGYRYEPTVDGFKP